MSIFAIGDLHLSLNPKIEKPMDIFGPKWENHVERLNVVWKDLICENDTVIIAGDISWALKMEDALLDLQWIDNLPGKKVIIKGNHDLWWKGITKLNQMYKSIFFLQNQTYQAEGYFICGTRGWSCPGSDEFSLADKKVYHRESLRLENSIKRAKEHNAEKIIGVLHYPPTNDKLQASNFTKIFTEAGVETVVYGHLHGDESYRKALSGNFNGVNYQLVSLDFLDCVPKKIV